MDALDIKESLGAKHVRATTPPTGATKAERLVEAQAHVQAFEAGRTDHVTEHRIAEKDDPGNTALSGTLAVDHQPGAER